MTLNGTVSAASIQDTEAPPTSMSPAGSAKSAAMPWVARVGQSSAS